ncbi:hypothetical protein MTO96_028752 [Rhipicephalus appendiculatus]
MIDPGSSDCILHHLAAEKCSLQVVRKAQELNGFRNADTTTVRSIGTSEFDIEIDDVVCRKVKVIVVNNSTLPVDMLVGRTWAEQDHIVHLCMGDELRIGYRDDLPFCNTHLAQMKPSKEPLRVKETIVLPKRTVCWVTVETGRSEGNLVLPTGTGKGMLLHIENGKAEISMFNSKDEDQQLIKGSLLAHAELLSRIEEITPVRPVLQQKPIDDSLLNVGKDIARWFDLLQEYHFEVKHRAGDKMAHVDYLNREPVGVPGDTLDDVVETRIQVCLTLNLEDEVLIIQRSDADLANLTRILEKPIKERTNEESGKVKNLRLKDGKLF